MPPAIYPTNPTVPGYNLTGNQGPASGVSGCVSSGVPFSCSGPWFIETQSMECTYQRVPFFSPSSIHWSLGEFSISGTPTPALGASGVPRVDFRIDSTHMLVNVHAVYQVTKSYDIYNTSAFTQPQQFQWFAASADIYGNTYGAVGASALGPAGSFASIPKWYHRRLWQSTDVTAFEYLDGCNGIAQRRSYIGAGSEQHAAHYKSIFQFWGNAFERGRGIGPAWASVGLYEYDFVGVATGYSLPGKYTTNQENPAQIANWIDYLGYRVGLAAFWPNPYDSEIEPDDNQGCPSYDISRHYWAL